MEGQTNVTLKQPKTRLSAGVTAWKSNTLSLQGGREVNRKGNEATKNPTRRRMFQCRHCHEIDFVNAKL